MASYPYTISGDFGNDFKQTQFYYEVNGATGITPNLSYVRSLGNTATIGFDSTLSGGEKTTLDTLVSNHTPDRSMSKEKFFIVTPKLTTSNSSTYTKIGMFKYGGSDTLGVIDYIDVLSHMDAGATSYDIKVEDSTNSQVLAEVTGLTNTTMDICDLGTISNIPTEEAIIALWVRVQTDSQNMYLESITIYHGNSEI